MDQWHVSRIHVQGNHHISDAALRELMVIWPDNFLDRPLFSHQQFEEDIRHILDAYKSRGFLDAVVDSQTIVIDSTSHSVTIHIAFNEGPQTTVEAVSFFGNIAFPEDTLTSILPIKSGDPFQKDRVQQSRLFLLELYANHGYMEAALEMGVRLNTQDHLAYVDFMITENQPYTIRHIRIYGLKKTNPDVIKRELTFNEGESIEYRKLLNSQRRLYLSGLFQSVFIVPTDIENDSLYQKDIHIRIQEKTTGEFNVALGYGSEEKIRIRSEIFETNVFGTARKISLSGRYSALLRGGEAAYSQPWTLGRRWQTDFKMKYEWIHSEAYEVLTYGAQLSTGKELLQNVRMTLKYRLETHSLRKVFAEPVPDRFRNNISGLAVTAIFDTRDNIFNTHRGLYAECSSELVGGFLMGSETYIKTMVRLKTFFPVKEKSVLGSAMNLGWLNTLGETEEIPINERFFAGGSGSIRGFEYQKLGPLDARGVPVGGRLLVEWHVLEYRFPVYKWFEGVLFSDAGNVLREADLLTIDSIRFTIGTGLRLTTPFGTGRLDIGWNMNPRNNEPAYQMYLNMGQIF